MESSRTRVPGFFSKTFLCSEPNTIPRSDFGKDLDGLRRSSRKRDQQVSEILLSCSGFNFGRQRTDLSRDSQTCMKFELRDGYRLQGRV